MQINTLCEITKVALISGTVLSFVKNTPNYGTELKYFVKQISYSRDATIFGTRGAARAIL